MQHRDESGKPCTRHAAIPEDRVLDLALLGSRTSGFHHDAASKLQSILMALDEIAELGADAGSELRTAVETGHRALRELHALLNENRALSKPPQPVVISLRELVARAAVRAGVKVASAAPELDVRVALPAMTHALELLIDLVAGPRAQGRSIEVAVEAGPRIAIALSGVGAEPTARTNEVLSIAAYAIHRDGGVLTCAGDRRVIVELPRP